MDRTLTPQQTALFGILLMSLWLFILGIWNIFALFSTLGSLPQMGLKVTWVTILIVILWKLLPLGIGLLLFRQHRFFVWQFRRRILSEGEDHNTWQHSPLLTALCIGLFGVFFTVQGIERLCAEQDVLWLILTINNPAAWQYIGGYVTQSRTKRVMAAIITLPANFLPACCWNRFYCWCWSYRTFFRKENRQVT